MPASGEGQRAELEPGYGELLWSPGLLAIDRARVTAYQRWLAAERGVEAEDYDALWRWSVADPAAFWPTIWDWFDVLGHRGSGPVLEGRMPDVQWFPGATINYARNALRTARTDPGRTALIFHVEGRADGSLTYGELAAETARIAAGLRAAGVGVGDRVAGLLPNGPHAVIALLAAASLGAVWSSCSPDFGLASVIDRFAQIEPKVLIAVPGYRYNGKEYRREDVVGQIAAGLPGLSAVVLAGQPQRQPDGPMSCTDGFGDVPVLDWDTFGDADGRTEPEYTEVPFGHPLWVLYSSGTTGLPKPIVHGHGGIVLEHLKALGPALDLGPGDVLLVHHDRLDDVELSGRRAAGRRDRRALRRQPTLPGHRRLWQLAEKSPGHLLRASARLPAGLREGRAVARPGPGPDRAARGRLHRLAAAARGLRLGVREREARRVAGARCRGGTDVCTAFVGRRPLMPVRAGVISAG